MYKVQVQMKSVPHVFDRRKYKGTLGEDDVSENLCKNLCEILTTVCEILATVCEKTEPPKNLA
jgi:hypothetical protein